MSQIQTNTWLPIDWENIPRNRPFLVSSKNDIDIITYDKQGKVFIRSNGYPLGTYYKSSITHYMVPEAPQN